MSEYVGIDQLLRLEKGLKAWVHAKALVTAPLLEGKRVLDVGCGIGMFAGEFAKRGFEVTGIDTSQKCIELARERHKGIEFAVDDGLVMAKLKGRKPFDSAVLFDVLEHIEDQDSLLKNIRAGLADGGVLVMSVPAFQALYSRHDKNIGHFRRYSKKSLRAVLEKNGYRVERMFHWNFIGMIGWLLVSRLLGRDPTEIASPLVNRAYSGLLKIESRITSPIGLSLIVKARKAA
ncbi:MAG: class I SAM-dependent methyltransferase [Candidatus Micrarchaeota archaeon]